MPSKMLTPTSIQRKLDWILHGRVPEEMSMSMSMTMDEMSVAQLAT